MAIETAERVQAAPTKATFAAWATLGVLLLFYILSFLDRQILAMMVDPIRRDLQIDDFRISLLMGLSFAALYTVFALLMGSVVDRYPRRLIVYAGVTLWSISTAACGLAAGFGHLFVARMAVGIGEATLVPATYSMLSDVFPRRRLSLALAIFTLGTVLGAGLSMVVGGGVIALVSSMPPIDLPIFGATRAWQVVFLVIGLSGIPLALLIFAIAEPKRTGLLIGQDAKATSWRDAITFVRLRWKLWTAILLAFAPCSTLANAVVLWGPSYMARGFGWTPVQIGTAIGLTVATAGGAGQLFSGWYVDKLLAKGLPDAAFRYFGWSLTISIPSIVVAFLVPSPALMLALIAIPFLVMFGNAGYVAAAIQMTTPNQFRGRMGGLFLLVVSIPGLVVGPSLIALLSTNLFGSDKSLGYSIALCAVAFVPLMVSGVVLGRRAMSELIAEAA
ncbi:MFS transporter [Sphingobium sp. Sx8-8]|uniref:MFS transporter n=1 Tax=Sphingobium sp. Sx8-8 TaxID=2933617 RepID=UPI001F5631CC|nr:MFS transporter [Sphingobium sp. Sx8-8]